MVVLDMSAGTAQQGIYTSDQQALPEVMDGPAFNSLSLGLARFPASQVTGPACIFNLPVWCGGSALPVVPLAAAGTALSSDPTGVRHHISAFLQSNSPPSDPADSAPAYDALVTGYTALAANPASRRALILMTSGHFSCASLSSPARPGLADVNGCSDWENPQSFNALITSHHNDVNAPISTFVIGLPGSDSTGAPQGSVDTPPYSMLLALSTFAVSGSAETVDPSCDEAAVWTQGGTAPAHPCHFDLSNAANFTQVSAEGAFASAAERAFGCIYDPPAGHTLDTANLNIDVVQQSASTLLPRRASPTDTCAATGCWDLSADQKIELLGRACDDVYGGATEQVQLTEGCATVFE